jgi:hypothetical protein
MDDEEPGICPACGANLLPRLLPYEAWTDEPAADEDFVESWGCPRGHRSEQPA